MMPKSQPRSGTKLSCRGDRRRPPLHRSISLRQTVAATYLKLTSCSLFFLILPISNETSKQATERSKASILGSAPSLTMLLIMNTISFSNRSFIVVERSLCCLLCWPVLPNILPTKTSSSLNGRRGCSLYADMMSRTHSSYLLDSP